LRRLPLRHSLAPHVVADFNFQHTLADIEANHVAVAYFQK
jgi:hypothetical protein